MFSPGPCPQFAIQDVFADPTGNWDGDQVNNSDELYNGLNPCIADTNKYCAGGGNPLCTYYTYLYVGPTGPCQQSVNAYPTGDYDRDGIRNAAEVRQGTSPCDVNRIQRLPHVTQHSTNRLPHVYSAPHTVYLAPKPPTPVCPHGYPYYHQGNGLCYANPVGHRYAY